MFDKMLPIGSVILIKNALRKAMIIGYMQVDNEESEKVYDYVGVAYPVGNLGASTQFLFNHSDISDVIFRGYTNPEWDEMIAALEKEIAEKPELAEKLKLHID